MSKLEERVDEIAGKYKKDTGYINMVGSVEKQVKELKPYICSLIQDINIENRNHYEALLLNKEQKIAELKYLLGDQK